MDVDIGDLRSEILAQLGDAGDLRALEEVRVAALGKKGRVTELVKQLGALPPEQRREAGPGVQRAQARGRGGARRARRAVLEAGGAGRPARGRADRRHPAGARAAARAASTR